MKIALCFIISYEHILNKENIWREWIEYNKDIINVYFYYKDKSKIKSSWILKHVIPENCIYETNYYHVIPAYLSLMNYAYHIDRQNQWFCFLTDSCCPIISPIKFRYLFYTNYNKSIFNWKKSWWNIQFHKRGNLALLPKELHLANDPWFVLKRENIGHCINFTQKKEFLKIFTTICKGGLANESLFAIILYLSRQLKDCICNVSHVADWSRMETSTSPHIFKNADEKDIQFIENIMKKKKEKEKEKEKEKYVMFIRKVSPDFPDTIIKKYIYEYSNLDNESFVVVYLFLVKYFFLVKYLLLFFFIKFIYSVYI